MRYQRRQLRRLHGLELNTTYSPISATKLAHSTLQPTASLCLALIPEYAGDVMISICNIVHPALDEPAACPPTVSLPYCVWPLRVKNCRCWVISVLCEFAIESSHIGKV